MLTSAKQLRWVIWGLSVGFFFYEFFLRVSPSVMLNELTQAFQIDAAVVGSLSAAYLYVYAPMQIPVGLLMDRFGARILLTIGTLACGIGSIVFGLAENYELAFIGRGLMGFGSSFAFVGMVYVGSHWFSHNRLPILVGIGNSLGMMGAIWGEDALGIVINHYSWRGTSVILGAIGVAMGLAIYALFCIVSDDIRPKNKRTESFTKVWQNLRLVCANKETWLNAGVALLMYATTTSFAGLWGINFIRAAYEIPVQHAAFLVSLIYLGWMVGGPIVGFVAERTFSRKLLLTASSFIGGVCMWMVIYITGWSDWALATLFIVVGIASSAQLLNFSCAVDINPRKAKGTAIALTNFLVMLAGSGLQPFIGYLMDLHSGYDSTQGTAGLALADYQFAFFCFPLTFFASFILCFFLKTVICHHISE